MYQTDGSQMVTNSSEEVDGCCVKVTTRAIHFRRYPICAHSQGTVASGPSSTAMPKNNIEVNHQCTTVKKQGRRRTHRPSKKKKTRPSQTNFSLATGCQPCLTKRTMHRTHPLQVISLHTSSTLHLCPPSNLTREIRANLISC